MFHWPLVVLEKVNRGLLTFMKFRRTEQRQPEIECICLNWRKNLSRLKNLNLHVVHRASRYANRFPWHPSQRLAQLHSRLVVTHRQMKRLFIWKYIGELRYLHRNTITTCRETQRGEIWPKMRKHKKTVGKPSRVCYLHENKTMLQCLMRTECASAHKWTLSELIFTELSSFIFFIFVCAPP